MFPNRLNIMHLQVVSSDVFDPRRGAIVLHLLPPIALLALAGWHIAECSPAGFLHSIVLCVNHEKKEGGGG
jgi:hypothetical protein